MVTRVVVHAVLKTCAFAPNRRFDGKGGPSPFFPLQRSQWCAVPAIHPVGSSRLLVRLLLTIPGLIWLILHYKMAQHSRPGSGADPSAAD